MTRPIRLLCAVPLLGVTLAGCSDGPSGSSASSSTMATSPSSTTTSHPAQPTGALYGTGAGALRAAAGDPTAAATSVRTTHGYDGAVAGASTVIFFTSPDGAAWTRVDAVTHPPSTTPLTVHGAVPGAAQHAVFSVTGAFKGDGAVKATLFGYDGQQWRGLTMTADRLQPTATAIERTGDPGSYVGARVDSRGVHTASLWGADSTAPPALQAAHPLQTTWAPAGVDFVPMSTNVFTAAAAPSVQPPSEGGAIPMGSDKDGTYVVRINSVTPDDRVAVQPVKPVTCTDPESFGCYDAVGSPFTLRFAPDARTTAVSAAYNIINVTAPPWLWAQVNGKRTTVLTPEMFVPGAPYVIPKGLVPSLDGMDTALITVRGGDIVKADSIFHP